MLMKKILESIKTIKNQRKIQSKTYVCINCGEPIEKLFRKYSEAVLKLEECSNCHEVADKYVEFEAIIILIDLVLLSQAAYRHVIFNVESKNLWKLAVILVLLESYCIWAERFGTQAEHKLFELEKAFYFSSLEVILANLLLFITIGIFGATSKSCYGDLKSSRLVFAFNLLRALILASIGNFFLCLLIFYDPATSMQVAIHVILVFGYFIVSLVRGHSVVSRSSQKISMFIVVLSFIVTSFILTEIDPLLKRLFF